VKAAFIALAATLAAAPGALAQDTNQHDPGVGISKPAAGDTNTTADPAASGRAERPTASDIARFLAGGALGLGLHESGHLVTSGIFGADPGVKGVSFGPIPFFAITHEPVSPAREYTIAASGFWVQHATSEWLLSRRPGLRRDHAPLAKGVLAFNVLASTAYATAAFGTFGPHERDTRAMANALGVAEPWVGGLILAPAVLDTWRYLKPESRWAAWTSRAMKVGAVLMVVKAASR
jgi:hypothetical protein